MRINWPWVSRKKYAQLEWQLHQTQLTLQVANSEIQHLCDRRLDHISKLASAAIEIRDLQQEVQAFKDGFAFRPAR